MVDPQVGISVVGSRTFTAVQELLWYNCSPFCGLSTLLLMVCLTYHASQVCCSQSSYTRSSPQLTCASAGDTQTLKSRSGSLSWGSLGPGAHKDFFEPCKSLRQACGLILNTICPSYCLLGASPLPLDMGYLFLVGSNILLSMAVQQVVAILEFSQKKMS